MERVIAAASERLWQLQTGIADWPKWEKDIEAARLEGPLAAGNTFIWTTAGLPQPIVSTIYLVEAKRSILWGGPSAGIAGMHRWTFDAVSAGPRVTTEESWSGAPIEANPAEAREMLEESLDLARLSRQSGDILVTKLAHNLEKPDESPTDPGFGADSLTGACGEASNWRGQQLRPRRW